MSEPRLFEYGDHWLVRRSDTPSLYIYWCRQGTRRVRRRSTGTADFEEAKLRLISFADDRNKPAVVEPANISSRSPTLWRPQPTAGNDPAILDVLTDYVEHFGDDQKLSRIRARTILRWWTEFCRLNDVVYVSELSLPVQEKYIAFRRDRLGIHIGVNGTLNRELKTVKAALNAAWRRGRLSFVPYIETLPNPPPRERFLTADEAQRLIAACDEDYVRRFVLLALHTLQRPKAIFALRVEQVDLLHNRIDFRSPTEAITNKRYAVVPITPTLRGELADAIAESKSGFVLERGGARLWSMRKAFATVARRAGLSDVTPYVLRHTGATLAAAAGVPIRQISGMLGHTSSAITEAVYAKHQPAFLGQMADTLDKLFGTPAAGEMTTDSVGAPVRAKCVPKVDFAADILDFNKSMTPKAPIVAATGSSPQKSAA